MTPLTVSEIPIMFTPKIGTTRQANRDSRNGKRDDAWKELVRIGGGWVSDYVRALPRHRARIVRWQAESGAKVFLLDNPWFLKKIGSHRYFIPPDQSWRWRRRIASLVSHAQKWLDAGVTPECICWNDESYFITDRNRHDIWRRNTELALAIDAILPDTIQHTYNCRMIRDGKIFPKVSPLTPGPNGVSMYRTTIGRNSVNLDDTIYAWRALGMHTWPWVQLHSVRRDNHWVRPYGPGFFWRMGAMISEAKCPRIIINEAHLLTETGENQWVVDNLAALIRGLNGDDRSEKDK